MIDMHTHILPGVDDGPEDIEESIKILQKGRDEGIKTFVLTPHIRTDTDWANVSKLNETFLLFKDECKKRGIDVELILGAEVLLVPNIVERIRDNPSVTIGGDGKYILIELPFSHLPFYAENVLFNLLLKNIIPILSHIERYRYLKIDNIMRWVSNGILLQMNSGSLTGRYEWLIKRRAKKLLKKDTIHFLGSDVHGFDEGKSLFSHAIKIISGILGKERTEDIIHRPYRILQGCIGT